MLHTTLRALSLAMLCLCASAPAAAQLPSPNQPVEIRGQLRYANVTPAFDVIVRLERQSGGYEGEVRTDRLGKFHFPGLVPLQYRLSVRHPGFKEIDREVNLVLQFSDYVQMTLVPDDASTKRAPSASGLVINASVPPEAQKEFDAAQAALLGDDKKKENLNEGIRHLEKAVSIYPNFLEAQVLLGMGYMDMKQWDKAEQALRQAVQLNTKAVTAYFALGEVYRQQKKYKEAEQTLLEGLKLDDNSVQGHFTLGRLYYDKGELVKAGPHVGTALQRNPKLAEGHLLAGNILLRVRQAENALAEFQAYLVLAPNGEFAPQARDIVAKLKQALANKKP